MERKEETSWAVVGSKGWKAVVVAGSWRVSEEEEEAGESVGRRLPVRVSQMDMVRWGWVEEGVGVGGEGCDGAVLGGCRTWS